MTRSVPFFGDFYRRTTTPLLSAEVTAREASLIARLLPPGRSLDLGCGAGRHLASLRRPGLVGLDFDHGSLLEARGHAPVVEGDLRALPFRTGSFDAVYCWYSTLFVFDAAGNARALGEAARIIRSGGTLLTQSVNPARLREAPDARFETTLPDGARLTEESHFDARTGRDEGTRTLENRGGERICASYSIRYYALPELSALCRGAGLKVQAAFGGVGGEPFRDDSFDLIVQATKD